MSTLIVMGGIAPGHPSSLLPGALVAESACSAGVRRSTRDWMVDVSWLFLPMVIGGGFFLLNRSTQSMPEWLQIADLTCGTAACLVLWLRRRWPIGVAVALAALGVVSSSTAAAAGVALFTVAVHRRFPVAAVVGGLYIGIGAAYWVLWDKKTDPVWVDAAFSVGLTVFFNAATVAWGMFVRARRQLIFSLRERARRVESEHQLRVEQARRLERERIAREMHDVLAHRISLLSVHAGALEFHPDAPTEEVVRAASVIRQNAHEALEDLRRVIGVLREPIDVESPEPPEPPQPTLAGLPALVEDSRQAGMRVRFRNELADLAAVPTDLGRDAYRIVQEGLTNARKHAPACAVGLAVAGAAGAGLTVEVRNRLPAGGGPAPEIPGAGTGIVGLTERAALAGGRLEHGETGDGDYRLWAWLPWPG